MGPQPPEDRCHLQSLELMFCISMYGELLMGLSLYLYAVKKAK